MVFLALKNNLIFLRGNKIDNSTTTSYINNKKEEEENFVD